MTDSNDTQLDVPPEVAFSVADEEGQSTSQPWRPGWRQTPWPSMVLILIMLACMGVSAGIIVGSNGQTVDSWKIKPSVLLATLSSICNYSLGAILAVSVAITWWRTALHGTKLENLHYIWNRGAVLKLVSALRSSPAVRKVALLTWLVMAVQIINNPLLQRSTGIETQNVIIPESMTVDMTRRLPDGWFGEVKNASTSSIGGSRDGLSTTQDWWKNATIENSSANRTGTQCNGTCLGNVQGTGIAYSCSSTTTAIDISAKENIGSVIFAINTTLSANSTGAPILLLTTLFASAIKDSCETTLNITTCNIEAAILEYPIIMRNNTITLDASNIQPSSVVTKFISTGDLPTTPEGKGAGPLEGLNDFLGFYLAANATLLIDQSRNMSLYSGGGGLIPDLFFLTSASDYDDSIQSKCSLKWADPTPYMLASMQDFLFRASILASTDADAQTISVQRMTLALVFRSEYSYLGAAMAALLFALIGLLWQLWAFWELGRRVSLSPLEVVWAFRALKTQRESHPATVVDIMELVGKDEVKYNGELSRFSGSVVVDQGSEEVRDGGTRNNDVPSAPVTSAEQ